MRLWLFVMAAFALGGCMARDCALTTGEIAEIEAGVMAVLQRQQDAWNRGSIDEFLVGYLPTEELTFVSGGEVRRGFAETRERYHERYGMPDAMGRLSFSDLIARVLARDAAVVTGAWRLVRHDDAPRGRFTLLFRRIDGEWLIVLDHTSSAE